MSQNIDYSQFNTHTVNCCVCQSAEYKVFCQKNLMIYVQCLNCKHIYIHDQINEEDLQKIYVHRKSHHNSDLKVAWDYSPLKEKFFYSHLIKKIAHYVQPGLMLDVGCSNGSFAHASKAHGWDAVGVELEKESYLVAEERGLKVYRGELLSHKLPDNHFDAITMWNVLEHLSNPREIVKEIHRILKPGGIFAVCVPNIKSMGWYLLKENWDSIEPQIHMNLFSPKGLRKFMKNLNFSTKYIEAIDIKPATIKAWLRNLSNNTIKKDTNSVAEMAIKSNRKMRWMLRLRHITNVPLRIFGIGEDIFGYFQK